MKPRSISIFLLEGDPDGIRQAQIAMSTIHAIAFRKTKFKDALEELPELYKTGIYILTGVDENDSSVAYIGQSSNVAKRLKNHAIDESKSFWVETIVLVSKDEELNQSHSIYVEAKLISAALKNPRWKLVNSQLADEFGRLPRPQAVAMDEFVDQTKTLVRALGCDLFKLISGNLLVADTSSGSTVPSNEIFEFRGTGFLGRMSISDNGEFVILKGSVARTIVNAAIPRSAVTLRENLLSKGILVEVPEGLRFNSDFAFPSVSSAAVVIYGGNINGRTAWKLLDGRTYSDWEGDRNSTL